MRTLTYDWTGGASALLEQVEGTPVSIRPNYVLRGKSQEMLRKAALGIAAEIEKQKKIPFTGTLKSFALRVSPFSTIDEGAKALKALMRSVECAAGYYSAFRGGIVLELEKGWEAVRDLTAFGEYLSYIQANRNYICWIFVLPDQAPDALLDCISHYCVYYQIDVPAPTTEHLTTLFRLVAWERGFEVTEDAQKRLTAKSGKTTITGNFPLIVENLVDKAVFFHMSNGCSDMTITARDIDKLTLEIPTVSIPKRQIGFVRGD